MLSMKEKFFIFKKLALPCLAALLVLFLGVAFLIYAMNSVIDLHIVGIIIMGILIIEAALVYVILISKHKDYLINMILETNKRREQEQQQFEHKQKFKKITVKIS